MIIKDENFRNYYKRPILIKNKNFARQIAQTLQIDSIWEDRLTGDEMKEKIQSIEVDEKINAIFAIPYIDHEMGISFQTMSVAHLNGKDANICTRKKFDALSIFRKGDVNDSEFEYLSDLNTNDEFNFRDYEEFAKIVDHYHVNDKVEMLRFADILDASRHEDYPDDLETLFIKDGLKIEKMWVRCEDVAEDQQIIAELMNTPFQDFGIEEGNMVHVFPYRLESGEWVVICDLNKREE